MKVEILNGLKPTVVDATRVLVSSDAGTPIALVYEYQPGLFYTTTCDDPNFNRILESLGIDRTVVLDTINLKSFEELGKH